MEKFYKSIRLISYGLFVVCSKLGNKFNGLIVNTIFQITSDPHMVAVSISKKNYTHKFIKKSKVFTASILSTETPLKFIGRFGFHSGKDYDEFDLICHVAFDKKPLTRKDRANNARKLNYFDKYGEQARKVIDALITKYEDEGIKNIEDLRILKVNPFNKFGTPFEIMKYFGGKIKYIKALKEIEKAIYSR